MACPGPELVWDAMGQSYRTKCGRLSIYGTWTQTLVGTKTLINRESWADGMLIGMRRRQLLRCPPEREKYTEHIGGGGLYSSTGIQIWDEIECDVSQKRWASRRPHRLRGLPSLRVMLTPEAGWMDRVQNYLLPDRKGKAPLSSDEQVRSISAPAATRQRIYSFHLSRGVFLNG